MGTFSGGGTPTSSNGGFWNGNIPWISSSDLEEDNILKINISRFITQDAIEKSSTKLCKAPSILIVSRVGVGKVALSLNDVCTSQDFTNISELKCDQLYLAFQLSKVMKKAANEVQGTSIKGISSSEIKSKKIFLPPIIEQEKIASFLENIEERIQTQRKIISQLKSQMSNLKDLIFEQKLRFTDDKENEFPDWQESKLEDICEKQSSSISANKIEDNIGDYPIYGATGILKNIDFYEVENDYISIIKDGAGVGRLLYCEGKSSVLGTLDIIQSKNVKLYFIFLLLSRIDFKKYITGSTIPHIYFKDYKKEKFQIPSIEEQEKIANFFKSLDDKINLENDLLIQFENQKKYLLQNLFV